ncbi:MAG: hypothetical protein ACTSVV_18560, partial [Promethearchaeota archaeon]
MKLESIIRGKLMKIKNLEKGIQKGKIITFLIQLDKTNDKTDYKNISGDDIFLISILDKKSDQIQSVASKVKEVYTSHDLSYSIMKVDAPFSFSMYARDPDDFEVSLEYLSRYKKEGK